MKEVMLFCAMFSGHKVTKCVKEINACVMSQGKYAVKRKADTKDNMVKCGKNKHVMNIDFCMYQTTRLAKAKELEVRREVYKCAEGRGYL